MKTTEFYIVDTVNAPPMVEEFFQRPEVLSIVREAIFKDLFWDGWLTNGFIVSTFDPGLEDELWDCFGEKLPPGAKMTFDAFRVKINFEVEKIEPVTIEGVESEEEAVTCCSTCGKEL